MGRDRAPCVPAPRASMVVDVSAANLPSPTEMMSWSAREVAIEGSRAALDHWRHPIRMLNACDYSAARGDSSNGKSVCRSERSFTRRRLGV